MRSILCFGDSNTFGFDGDNGGDRFPLDVRWPGALQMRLGDDYRIIEEGQPGRTIVCDDVVTGRSAGIRYLEPCLESHRPLDLVIVMLGTNDLKDRFALVPGEIGRAMQRAIGVIRNCAAGPDRAAPRVLLVAPVEVRHVPESSDWPSSVWTNPSQRSRDLADALRQVAVEISTEFTSICDARAFPVCDNDGVHLTAEGHRNVAKHLEPIVRNILRSPAKTTPRRFT